MASIKLKDYLVSLTSKSNAADLDILPLLDSDNGNNVATIKKGTLTDLDNITGWTAFSSSVEGDLFALSFASSSNVSSSLQQQIDINNLGVYTASLKQAITVSGNDVQIVGDLRAQKFFVDYITSSVALLTGSNEFGDEPTDNHTFIGRVYINGDGPIGLTQLNSFTGSQLSVNTGLYAVTGAFTTELAQIQSNVSSFNNVFNGVSAVTGAFATELGQLQTQNTSQDGVNSGVSAVTGAFATELGQLQTQNTSQSGVNTGLSAVTGAFATELGQLQTQNTAQSGVNSGVSAVTGAFATELGELQNNVTDFTNVLSGVAAVSGAIVTELSGIQNNITSFNNVFNGVSAVTGAFTTELGDIQTILSGHRGEISGLEDFTASLDSTYATDAQVADAVAGLNTQTGSQNLINNGVSAVTGAFSTELGGIQSNITSFNSVFGGVSAVTGAFATELGGIQTQLTNRRGELNGLEAYTSSLKGAIQVNGQDVNVLGMLTAQQFNVTYVSSSTMYQSGSTKFGDTSDDTHQFTGSLSISGSAGVSGIGLNSSLRLNNVTDSTGNDWHLYSLNNGNFGLYNNSDGLYTFQSDASGNMIVGGGTALATAANRGNLTINGTNTSILSFGTSDALKSYVYNDGTNMKINTGDGILVVESQNVETLYVNSGSVNIKGQNPSVDGAILTLENSDTSILANQTLGHLNFYTNDTSTTSAGGVGGIVVKAETNFDTSLTPTYMSFFTHDAVVNDGSTLGNVSEAMRLDSDRVLSLPQSSNNGTFNFNGTAMELDVNRHPETGVFSDTGKSHARISLNGANGGSEILLNTAAANNTTSTTRVTIESNGDMTIEDGNLVIGTAGKGIDFSATADGSGTTTSELLDDYEEGTWTGTLRGSGSDPTTPVTATGYYTKVGNKVFATIAINNATTTGASGNVTVSGLPFTSASTNNSQGSVMCTFYDFNGGTSLVALLGGSSSSVSFLSILDDGDWNDVLHVAGSGRSLRFNITYFV